MIRIHKPLSKSYSLDKSWDYWSCLYEKNQEVFRQLDNRAGHPRCDLDHLGPHLAVPGPEVGKMLLAAAIKRTLAAGDQIAINAIVADANNENAKEFYERFGFTPISDDSPRIFLPLKSIHLNAGRG